MLFNNTLDHGVKKTLCLIIRICNFYINIHIKVFRILHIYKKIKGKQFLAKHTMGDINCKKKKIIQHKMHHLFQKV